MLGLADKVKVSIWDKVVHCEVMRRVETPFFPSV